MNKFSIIINIFLLTGCSNNERIVLNNKVIVLPEQNNLDSLISVICEIEDTIPVSNIKNILSDEKFDDSFRKSKYLFKGMYKFQKLNILCLLRGSENQGEIILISYDSVIRDVKTINSYHDNSSFPLHTVIIDEELERIEIIEFNQENPKAMPHPDDIQTGKKEIWVIDSNGSFQPKNKL